MAEQKYYEGTRINEAKFSELFVNRLQGILDERGMSHYQLSVKAHIHQSSISTIFVRGTLPNFMTVARICHGLGITIADFFAEGFGPVEYTAKEPDEIQLTLLDMNDEQKAIALSYMKGLLGKL